MLGLNVGVDLGTVSIQISVQGKGIVLSEPSVAARDAGTRHLLALGREAYEMLGKNPESIDVIKPMRDGVISDFSVTTQILRRYLERICGNTIFKPNVIICMPSTVTNLERRTVLDAITSSGAGRACLIEEPLAAALGAGLDISHPYGTLVVDIGGGTTDVAVITMGCIAISSSLKVAGNTFDDAIRDYVKYEKNVLIGELTAEEIKKTVGGAVQRRDVLAMVAKGKDYVTGMPRSFEITSSEVYQALRAPLSRVLEVIHSILEITPPELASDISAEGILLTGGGSLLYGMDQMIYGRTGIPTRVAEEAVYCVAKGIGLAFKNLDLLENNGYRFKTREEIRGFSEY